MTILKDLNKAFVIRQESGRKVPLNDLDCCLISMKELKIEQYLTSLKRQKESHHNSTAQTSEKADHHSDQHFFNQSRYDSHTSYDPKELVFFATRLPFLNMKVNLYSYVVTNSAGELRLLEL